MLREKIPAPLKAAIKKFVASKEKARDATNESNRIKTELRNAVKEHWTKEEFPIGSFLRTSGLEIRYEANETSELDNEAVLKLYEKKQITREQFLRLFKVGKTEAKKILGADVVADLEVKSVGDKLDIRIEELPVENATDDFIGINRNIRVKVKRSVFGKNAEKREDRAKPAAPTLRRKIKVRK